MEAVRKDVVVVGLGAFGSAALWRLARRGMSVAGVERYGIGHEFGSSHGATRLFRIACLEHRELPALALKSLELWTELGRETGEVLVRQTGCLNVGAPDSTAVRGTLAAAAAAGVRVVELSHDELVARQPQYAGLAVRDVAVWDPGAGVCYPERNVIAQTAAARRLGAEVYPYTRVTAIESGRDGVTVRTPTVELRASQVIVAAGAWLGTLVPGLPITPRRTALSWFRTRDPAAEDFTLDRFPAFVRQRAAGDALWGHGSAEDYGIKIGVVDDRPQPNERERVPAVAEAFPGLDPTPAEVVPCLLTDSPDGQFLLGRLDARPRVVVAGGDSGHGFKHAAGVGELLARIVSDEPAFCETDFLAPARFDGGALLP